jgi:hypothetical protein
MNKVIITAKDSITIPLETIDKTIGDFIWGNGVEFTNNKIENNKLFLYVFDMGENNTENMINNKGFKKILITLGIVVETISLESNIPKEEEFRAACNDEDNC